MKRHLLNLVIGTALFASLCGTSPAASVTTDGFHILVDGKRFLFKGVNYSPVPNGTSTGQAPYGDYFTPQYKNVWKSDIDLMRAAGVNCIKLYAGDPAQNAGAPGSCGQWKEFLDYLYKGAGNERPIYVIMTSYINPGDIVHGTNLHRIANEWTSLVASTAKHPAVLGYTVGNEIFGDAAASDPNSAFWKNFGQIVDAARAAAQSQGETPLLLSAIEDIVQTHFVGGKTEKYWPVIEAGERSGCLTRLDAWADNVYRSRHLGAPDDNPIPAYRLQMEQLGKKKPFLIGEFGTPHSTRPPEVYKNHLSGNGQPVIDLETVDKSEFAEGKPYHGACTQGEYIKDVWKVIHEDATKASGATLNGGFVFNWCDEWYKMNGNPDVHSGGPNEAFNPRQAGGYYDERWFGITDSVDQNLYGHDKPLIKRKLNSGYEALKKMYE